MADAAEVRAKLAFVAACVTISAALFQLLYYVADRALPYDVVALAVYAVFAAISGRWFWRVRSDFDLGDLYFEGTRDGLGRLLLCSPIAGVLAAGGVHALIYGRPVG